MFLSLCRESLVSQLIRKPKLGKTNGLFLLLQVGLENPSRHETCQVPLKIQRQNSAKSQPPVLCAQFASTFLWFPNSLGSCQQKIFATNPNSSNCRCCWEAGSPLQEEVSSQHNTSGHSQKQKQSKTCTYAAKSYTAALQWREPTAQASHADGIGYAAATTTDLTLKKIMVGVHLRKGDRTIPPNRKTKWKQAFPKVGISISTLHQVGKNWVSVTFLTAMSLQHLSSAMQHNCLTNRVATLVVAIFPCFLRKEVVDNYVFILER